MPPPSPAITACAAGLYVLQACLEAGEGPLEGGGGLEAEGALFQKVTALEGEVSRLGKERSETGRRVAALKEREEVPNPPREACCFIVCTKGC